MKKSLLKIGALALLLCGAGGCQTESEPLSLAGEWSFALDSNDVGIKENWAAKPLDDRVNLPGSLQAQGKGEDISVNTQWTGDVVDRSWYSEERYAKYREPGNVKVPFWLNPDKHYVGVAWYQKEIEVPSSWKGKRIAQQDALQVPHRYMLYGLAPGKHLLALRVDNRVNINVGTNAHSVSDHTQTNWNGVIGDMTMQALPDFSIDNVQVYPDLRDKKANVKVYLDGRPENATLSLKVFFGGKSVLKKDVKVTPGKSASV